MEENKGQGVLMFAWLWLVIIGVFNIIEGVLALGDASFWVASTRFTFSNLATWGWILLVWGIVQCLAGGSIAKGANFGRWFGMLAAGVAIIIQLFFLPLYPIWGIMLIVVYAWILYGLAVYGGTHKPIGS